MSIKAIEAALAGNRIIMLAAQRSLEVRSEERRVGKECKA